MKATIVEIKEGYAAVLSDNGCIAKVKNNNYQIGQVIDMSSRRLNIAKRITFIAASAAAFLLIGTGTWAYASPYTYVSLDVNPSLEFVVNRFDRVLDVKAINDDGKELLKEIPINNLENKTIEQALSQTVKEISELGYFEGDIEAGLIITTSGKNTEKAEELADTLHEKAKEEIEATNENVVVETYSVGLERVEEAREFGVTPGKLNLVEKLKESATDPNSIDLEEWLNKSVKEIMKATKENRKATGETSEEASNQDSNTIADPSSESGSSEVEDKQPAGESDPIKSDSKAEEKTDKAHKKAEAEAKKAQEKAADAQQKTEEKAEKAQEKVTDAQLKAEEKAEKAQEKVTDAQLKAEEKAAKAQDKAADTQLKAEEKAERPQQNTGDKAAKSQNTADTQKKH